MQLGSTSDLDECRLRGLLRKASDGDQEARNAAFLLMYGELREAAEMLVQRHQFSRRRVRPTAVVHDLVVKWLRNTGSSCLAECRSFIALAVDAMEKLMIDRHRRDQAVKRGRDWRASSFDETVEQLEVESPFRFADLYEALQRLKVAHPQQYDVIRYRFFGGFTIQETAAALDISEANVVRCWRRARARLYSELAD